MRSYSRIAVISSLLSLVTPGSAAAQSIYPEKPIRMVLGFGTGGPQDTVARLLGQKFTEAWGKPVVIDNATGAGGAIAAGRVAKAAPDGYTLGLMTDASLVISPSLRQVAYDPTKDFAPVSQVTLSPIMLVVHDAVPAKSVSELVALAKAQPGALSFASAGIGSTTHMAAELFKSVAGIDIWHVPYKGVGVGLALTDLLGGRVTMAFSPLTSALPVVREGKLRAIAVTTLRRSSVVRDVPTIAESGYEGFEVALSYGLFAPAKTPAEIVRKLHLETGKALALPELRARLADLGLEGVGSSPDKYAAFIRSEIPKWAKVIVDAGIKSN